MSDGPNWPLAAITGAALTAAVAVVAITELRDAFAATERAPLPPPKPAVEEMGTTTLNPSRKRCDDGYTLVLRYVSPNFVAACARDFRPVRQ